MIDRFWKRQFPERSLSKHMEASWNCLSACAGRKSAYFAQEVDMDRTDSGRKAFSPPRFVTVPVNCTV